MNDVIMYPYQYCNITFEDQTQIKIKNARYNFMESN